MNGPFRILLLVLMLSYAGAALAAAPAVNEAARKQLALFLDGEVGGNACTRDHADLVQLHPKLRAKVDKELSVACLYLTSDPLHVVDAYEIKSLSLKGERGEAVVVFNELAEIAGEGSARLLTNIREKREIVYQLRFAKGRWLVYDPPAMRIGLEAIKNYYGMIVMGENNASRAANPSEEEKKLIDANKNILAGLHALSQ